MRERWGALAGSSLLVAVMMFGVSGVALADGPTCMLGTLEGLYVFTATGFTTISPATTPTSPKAIVELVRFNGDGTVVVPGGTLSFNGVIRENLSGTGTYTVADADGACAGSLTFADGPKFDLFFSPKGRDVSMIQTNTNNVFQGTATKVSH